jgi:tetratricopeptide (TPR) repeat protein
MGKDYLFFLSFLLLLFGCKPPAPRNLKELEIKAYEALESGHFNTSIKYYNQLIEADRFNGSYYFGRGYSNMRLLRQEEAEQDFLKSAELKYKLCGCYYNIGLMNTFKTDSIALTYFEKALQICPDRNDIKKEHDECLIRLSK